uniref:SET domain-containing protein n=1 Tax=Ditylenchus dipsaci TaxID=166011 RepID=A0A915D5Z1_9BILA
MFQMDLDNHRAIDAHYYGNDMRYVNHSCEPNCTVQVVATDSDIHIVLVALRKSTKVKSCLSTTTCIPKPKGQCPNADVML